MFSLLHFLPIGHKFTVLFVKMTKSLYRESYSFAIDITQDTCLACHQEEDEDLRHLVQYDIEENREGTQD